MLQFPDTRGAQNSKNGTRIFALKDMARASNASFRRGTTSSRLNLAYGLSLRDLKEMMAERGISIDHTTINRWVVHFSPLLLKRFNRRKRPVTGKWHADEAYWDRPTHADAFDQAPRHVGQW
jgi:hypothetical protein